MYTLYGIANCDTVRKARKWLTSHDLEYVLHDYKKQGIDEPRLRQWCSELGYEQLVNRRGTTWRGLDAASKQDLDEDKAVRLMLANPSLIKRPLLDTGRTKILGFDAGQYESLL